MSAYRYGVSDCKLYDPTGLPVAYDDAQNLLALEISLLQDLLARVGDMPRWYPIGRSALDILRHNLDQELARSHAEQLRDLGMGKAELVSVDGAVSWWDIDGHSVTTDGEQVSVVKYGWRWGNE